MNPMVRANASRDSKQHSTSVVLLLRGAREHKSHPEPATTRCHLNQTQIAIRFRCHANDAHSWLNRDDQFANDVAIGAEQLAHRAQLATANDADLARLRRQHHQSDWRQFRRAEDHQSRANDQLADLMLQAKGDVSA